MAKNNDFIAHVCLNSRLPKNHKDFCERGFVAEAPSQESCKEQCWKYCAVCEAKGFPIIKNYTKNPKRVAQGKIFGYKPK